MAVNHPGGEGKKQNGEGVGNLAGKNRPYRAAATDRTGDRLKKSTSSKNIVGK